jgi:uncharacterized repeat protein (TIGR03803 family)
MRALHLIPLLLLTAVLSLASSNASAEAKETVLYGFPACRVPSITCGVAGQLALDAAGNLYGVTGAGGSQGCDFNLGCGTVFELSPSKAGGWTETVLYMFQGGSDGYYPQAGVILDAAGNLYGTTSAGGSFCEVGGCGTVFELSHSANGWRESVLYSFSGPDGDSPNAGLTFDKLGNLYGTTMHGGFAADCAGNGGCGVVFELSPSSGGWNETVPYAFTGTHDGAFPASALVFDYLGDLYGTAEGGVYGDGVVFRLIPSADGWTQNTIWSFSGGDSGELPDSSGVVVHGNALYGVTYFGGGFNVGYVFQLTPARGNWTLDTIYTFTGGNDGGEPIAGLIAGKSHLYGTTDFGGLYQWGTVFRLTAGAGDSWTEDVLYNFTGGSDGGNPDTPLLFGPAALFGAANVSGGLVYEITPP